MTAKEKQEIAEGLDRISKNLDAFNSGRIVPMTIVTPSGVGSSYSVRTVIARPSPQPATNASSRATS